MKIINKKAIIILAGLLVLQASIVLGAPVIFLESKNIHPGDTSVEIGLFIQTDPSAPVDSATFTIADTQGIALTDVALFTPVGWVPTVNLPKFGATDFGWPSNPITGDTLFATLTFSFAADLFQPGSEKRQIHFLFVELSDDEGSPYVGAMGSMEGGELAAVPIPSTVLLLGSGLFGLVALRRKRS